MALSLLFPNFLPFTAASVPVIKKIVSEQQPKSKDSMIEKTQPIKPETKPIKDAKIQPVKLKPSVGAWLPHWDQKNMAKDFRKNKRLLNEVSPYWYSVHSSGNLIPTDKFDMSIIKEAKQSDIKVMPMISNNFDGQMIGNIINNPTLRKNHINQIVKRVLSHKVDGVDLDYEGLLPKDRKMFSYFVRVLADKLHAHNKILSVTLQAKTQEPGVTQATKAQDWRSLGKYADRLHIMAYDYHWKTSGPGPIAPVFWIDQVAKFAKSTIPARKAIIAVGTYGYDWSSGGRAKALSAAKAHQMAKASKQPIRRDPKSHEQFLKIGPGKPKIWLQDSGSLKTKMKIVKKYNLGGIFFWKLGDEEPVTWKVVENQLR